MNKNKRLISIYTLNWIISILCVCMIDSKTDIPFIVLCICMGWNSIFTAVNVSKIRRRE